MTTTCDTSVLVPALTSWHTAHEEARDVLSTRVDAIVGHVLVETYSVLTRLPAPYRLTARVAGAVVSGLGHRVIDMGDPRALVSRLAEAGVVGGAAYDALIATTAAEHGCLLLTRDRRARTTYDTLGVRYEVV